jgi:hypothetical protein
LNKFADLNPIYGRRITMGCIPPSNLIANLMPPPPPPPSPSQSTYVTDVKFSRDIYKNMNYMNTHLYEEQKFDRYIETGNIVYTPFNTNNNGFISISDDSDDQWEPSTTQPQPQPQPPPPTTFQQILLNHFANPYPPANPTPTLINNTPVNMEIDEEEQDDETIVEGDDEAEEEEEEEEEEQETYIAWEEDGYDSVS